MPSKYGYNDYKKAQYISQMQADAYENELRRNRERAAREARKNSPEGIAEQQKRNANQELTRAHDAKIKNEIENLDAVLLTMIDDLEVSIKEEIKNSSVKDILKKYEKELAYIQEKDERVATILKNRHPGYRFSYLGKLFYKLSIIDPHFILEAPAKTFMCTKEKNGKQANFNLDDLTKTELATLYKRIKEEDKTISKDDHFACHYAKYFKEEIKNLKQLRDVKSCLARYPEAYPELHQSTKVLLNAKDEMAWLITRAPSIIKYMTKEEIEVLATNSLKLIASAAMKDAEILDYLDEDFFSRHDYRICFTNYAKAKVRQALGDKVKRHARLQTFINIKNENRSYNDSLYF